MIERHTLFVVAVAALAAGCSLLGPGKTGPYEAFESTTRYSRRIDATSAQACEAARRALLSQGYVVSQVSPEQLSGRKAFQVEGASHVQIDVQVVCTTDTGASERALVFASALQDRYELKKGASSASVGVGAVGSLSLPFASGSESLVKVASETLDSDLFYDGFFAVLTRYLNHDN